MTPRVVCFSAFKKSNAFAVSGSETTSRAAAIDVTNFAISMAASLAGVALAEVLVAVCAHAHGCVLSRIARRCCDELCHATAALACAA